ncbi:MAG TPA: TonB-dependent receptor, partial [Rhizomicrobium sp.]|nr:TonB-dependent receptor [Rhizomicrobium sp.]
MIKRHYLKYTIICFTSVAASAAYATTFNVPGGDLKTALDDFMRESGVALMYPTAELKGIHTAGVRGELSADDALEHILAGTGFSMHRHSSGMVGIVRSDSHAENARESDTVDLAAANAPAATGAALETVTVTSSKIGGDVQSIPISITALSQEQLTTRQIAGGPDLVKEVPNLTFSKTNFTGYNIQIRGIGTQAISVTTDPAVAVALNDIPFIRNHFFEQEFYDLSQAEVLRGPQGTLYGRNATAGVVNIVTAKPSDQFESMVSADIGNYNNRRMEGMLNIPIIDDRLDMRFAGEWTKRDGYSFNEITDRPIDGRDLWSGRFSMSWKPIEALQANFVWEHFSEDDNRLRSSKQLCKTDEGPASVDGISMGDNGFDAKRSYLSQGCLPTSLYSPDAFEVPNGYSLPYLAADFYFSTISRDTNPYASMTQSRNLRVIESTLDPTYKAKNDTLEFNMNYNMTPEITFVSQTGFNQDRLWSAEDYNRFASSPHLFNYDPTDPLMIIRPDGSFCDPQLGCADRLVAEDLSDEHAWQLSQEFRVESHFTGPLNFSFGGNYLHYETEENYYVFINAITLFAAAGDSGGTGPVSVPVPPWNPGVSDNSQC